MRRLSIFLCALFFVARTFALGESEEKAVKAEVAKQVRLAQAIDGGREMRQGRRLLERKIKADAKPALVVFFTLEGGGNNFMSYLVLLRDRGQGYTTVAGGAVGSAIQRIDYGYVELSETEIACRSEELDDVTNEALYGEEKIYFRWRMEAGQLKPIAGTWLKRDGKWVEARTKP